MYAYVDHLRHLLVFRFPPLKMYCDGEAKKVETDH